MLSPDTTNKCMECGNHAKRKYLGKYYCKEHYMLEVFGCDDIHIYIDKNEIAHMHSAIDNHIIINQRNKQIIEMCILLKVEYWFGKGMVGNTDLSDSMHIDTI